MVERGNVIDIMQAAAATRRVQLSDAARRLVDACRRTVARTLPPLLAGLFERLDDALFDMADKSDRDALQTVYFDVMRTVRKARTHIGDQFLSGVLAGFDRLWAVQGRVSSSPAEVAERDMALVADDDLEETLAVTNLISKGESLYRRELYVLNERLSSLGGVQVDNRTNPVGSAAICQAFRDAIADLAVDVPVKLVMYKLFDKQAMHYVGGLYDEINGLMAREGILPNLVPRARRNPVSPALREEQPGRTAASPGGTARAQRGGRRTDDVLGTLRGLLEAHRHRTPDTDDRADAGLPVEPAELVAALSSLQHAGSLTALQAGGAPGTVAAVAVRELLAQALGIGSGAGARVIGPMEDDIIEVVTLLFEVIARDSSIPDAMKVLIARLQIPVLKVALLDGGFFSNNAHPARRLLNRLAAAAVGWSGEADPAKDALYARLLSMVDRLLADFNRDLDIFNRLDDELAVFVDEQERGARVAEERAAQITRGKEQLTLAKKRVGDEIVRRLEGCTVPVPQVARTLIEDGWKDLMLLVFLRQGPESKEWGGVLRVVDELLWSVAPKGGYAERQELLQRIPDLLRRLREGLAGISFDQHKMNTLLKELQGVHIASLRPAASPATSGGDEASGNARGPGPSPGVEDSGRVRPEGGAPADAYLQQAAQLDVGSWLDIRAQDGRTRRVKLSWRSSVSDLCVLVNSRGSKVMDLDLQALARMLREGRAQPVARSEVPLVDRALAALFASLRDPSSEGPGLSG